MRIEIETVKGFQDFMPKEALKREKVKSIIAKWFKLYGFLPLETPVVEFDNLMRSENENDESVSDRFRLRDRGNRDLGLRYEFTFQLARILKQNPNLKFPFKRYQIGEVFRDEPVSSTRFRQFTQCDADIIGDPTPNADAEILAVFSDILKELKIKNEVQINNRKLLSAIIESVQMSETEEVMREIDKIEKIGIDIVKANLRRYGSTNQIVTLFKLLEKDIKFFKENAFPGFEEVEKLLKLSKQYGIKIKFNPFLSRGLSYYTGNIFEFRVPGQRDSIAGGGRYDKTVGKYSARDIPATGCSFGLERITQLAAIAIPKLPKAIILSISQDEKAISLAKQLRRNKIPCTLLSGKPTKALEYANAQEINYVVFVGEEEIQKDKFKFKNMANGEEILLSEKQLIAKLKEKDKK